MIQFVHKGNFKKTERFLKAVLSQDYLHVLDKYGQAGVDALAAATPRDTGLTAASWYYEIQKSNGNVIIRWKNSNVQNGVNIALILQFGHGTRNGGYVQGRDYINPALRPIFDQMAEDVWREVLKS